MRSYTAALLLTALAFGTGARAAPVPPSCPRAGAVYVARVDDRAARPAYRHQVRIGLTDPGGAVWDAWVFEVVDRRTGRVVTTLRMLRPCGNGRLPCYVAPASHDSAKDDGFSSEVIEIDRDLSIHSGEEAPDALILSGFAQNAWDPIMANYLRKDLHYLTRDHVFPDFEHDQVWIRSRCGR